jgi:mono/diheme cytochrome c family protein
LARWKKADRLALFATALLALPALAGDDALAFRSHGAAVVSRDLSALKKLVPPEPVRVFEPYEQREVAYTALRLDRVLDALYGKAWRTEEELLFTCRDGYQPSVPVARVLGHAAWLAFARADQPAFTLHKLESGRYQDVALGPFYLIWENIADKQMRAEGDYAWPYQLVGVDLIRVADRFPKLVPPASASPLAQRGFREFRIHCSRCHPMNGEGGQIGPELNSAQNPAGRRDPVWLRRWIDQPSRLVPTARMEPLSPELPDRDAVLDAIVAYLQAMAPAK